MARKIRKSGKKVSKAQRKADYRRTVAIIGTALAVVLVIFLLAAGIF